MRLADLAPCSFRGVRCWAPKDEIHEGRNVVDHRWPDSNRRYAEDNGAIPPEFKLSLILFGDGLPGQVAALRSALMRPGPGTLRHPWAGSVLVAVKGPYTVNREDSDSGVVRFDVTFLKTDGPVFPALVSGIAAMVSSLASAATSGIFSGLAGALAGSVGGLASLSPLSGGIGALAGLANSGNLAAIASFGGGVDFAGKLDLGGAFTDFGLGELSGVSRDVVGGGIKTIAGALSDAFLSSGSAPDTLLAAAARLADEPARLATLLHDGFRAPFADASLSEPALVRGFESVADASAVVTADALDIPTTTLDREVRATALWTIGVYCEAAAFVGLAESMAARDYPTADLVEADETTLIRRFDRIQSLALPAGIGQALHVILTAASEVLRDAEVRLPRIADIDANMMPASVLCYSLYDTDTDQTRIVDLNVLQNPILYDGPTSVLAT